MKLASVATMVDFPIAWFVLAFAVGVQEHFLEVEQEAGMRGPGRHRLLLLSGLGRALVPQAAAPCPVAADIAPWTSFPPLVSKLLLFMWCLE
ncbi:hypothetical protein RPHASCH2410_PD04215 (plasmid) [Rhizobium phaseoli Ch24-10]|nr:hypothetical protein RPHASCH2410_PD04215 [Rhizobium phaseoli Ch24-10]